MAGCSTEEGVSSVEAAGELALATSFFAFLDFLLLALKISIELFGVFDYYYLLYLYYLNNSSLNLSCHSVCHLSLMIMCSSRAANNLIHAQVGQPTI